MSAPSSGPDLRPAALDEAALDDLRRLEERLGIPVVAYEAASPYADLTDAQLAEIQRAEAALGVRLLAYRRA
ncbi:MAG TPA: hypothetical protein VK935_16995 [Actinomycetospora sp.]|nr:hypothetical protein [Actinomycetospora sp.]